MMETAVFLHEITRDDISPNLLGPVPGFECGILCLLGKQVVRGCSDAYVGIVLISVSFL